jgi:hypothetical protein
MFEAQLLPGAIVHTRVKPYCLRTNGKVEHYNRTVLNEWAYARLYRSETARARALDKWSSSESLSRSPRIRRRRFRLEV